jgi:cell division protein FtsI/penicillin-binding protein 2
VIGERTRRLFALVAAAFVVLFLRLAWIQIAEHDIWAEEAARLVHSGEVIPYERGAITDANGVVLAHDVEAYELSFEHRPFRRDHPVGQVAHARTALEVRSVTYREASQNLERWAEELVRLLPADVKAFGKGAGLVTPSLDLAPTADPRADARGGRAADVKFYVRGLLGAAPRSWSATLKLAEDRPEASFLELFAAVSESAPEALLAGLHARWSRSLADLDYLAREIELEGASDAAPFDVLLELLEDSRRAVEGAAASALFEEAAGFPAGRVEPRTLVEAFDLEELRLILRWDARDLADWAVRTHDRWRAAWRDGYALPRLVEQLTLDPGVPPDADRVVSMLASLFGSDEDLGRALDGDPVDWREGGELGVFRGLGGLFRSALPPDVEEAGAAVLPWQGSALRSFPAPATWSLLDDVRVPLPDTAFPGRWAEVWRASLESRSSAARETRHALARELADGWETRMQEALGAALAGALAAAAPEDLGPGGGLRFRRALLDRIDERAAYILKDYGSRARTLGGAPSYDVVYLLAAFPERFPGFDARDARRRERVTLEGDERPLAEGLIGFVSRADVRAMQRQRADEQRKRELEQKAERSPREEDELGALLESVLLPEEFKGVAGIEGYFDPELRGRNGYREDRGLDDLYGEAHIKEAANGHALRLTLVAELQRAAEHVITHPAVPDDPKYDPRWYEEPVGAIVLITADGDVLAAASGPLDDGRPQPVMERTLRVPTFQPPGSVFKPFVAAWALDRDGLDPRAMVDCTVLEDGRPGYVDVHCWDVTGHGPVDLSDALMGSCNSYFAWLGEGLTTEDLRGAAHAFGFGEPTGVRTAPPGDLREGARGGLVEHDSSYIFERELKDSERRRAGNGLAVVEATPLQVARATAGLATGTLPTLRLVSAVGGTPVARAPARPVPISAEALDLVRAGLLRVTQDAGGTAHKALSRDELGFVLAAKTGSADLVGRGAKDSDGRVRKHAWVAGYAPVEDPAFVLVVFIHDTSATSSHGAVYVARQFLEEPAVRTWLGEHGLAEGER